MTLWLNMNAIANKELNIMRENVAKFAVWQNSNSLYAAEIAVNIYPYFSSDATQAYSFAASAVES